MAKNKTIGRSGNFSQTPQEWEAATGNKLLSYRTDKSGMLDIGNMKYKTAAKLAEEASAKSSPGASMVESSFGRMIGGSPSGGGFIGSMGGLEAASMRLADAAARREKDLISTRGAQDVAVMKAKSAQEQELEAQRLGYRSAKEMQEDIKRKRIAEEAEIEKQKKYPSSVDALEKMKAASSLFSLFKGGVVGK